MHKPHLDAFDTVDALVLGGAVVGIILYLFVLPQVHPDRLAREGASREDVSQIAREFLSDRAGYSLDQAPTSVRIERNQRLLDSLTARFGGGGRLKDAGLPAYYWEVNLRDAREGETDDDEGADVRIGSGPPEDFDDVGFMHLTLDGRPFGIDLEETPALLPAMQWGVFEALLADSSSASALDTIDASRFSFRIDESRTDSDESAVDGRFDPNLLLSETHVILGASDAAAIALHHLGSTMLGDTARFGAAHVDSVEASGEAGRLTATVYVSSTKTEFGSSYTAEVEVAPTGALVRLSPDFVRPASTDGFELGDIFGILSAIIFVLLSILAFVIFLQRLRHQLVDVSGAFRDAVAVTVATALALFASVTTEVTWGLSFELLMMSLGLTLLSITAGILLFFVSGSVTSIARDVWSEKLLTLDLLRVGFVRNRPVGCSLVRGTLLGVTVVGLATTALALLPITAIDLPDDPAFFTMPVPGLGFVSAAAQAFFYAVFLALAIVLLPGTLVRRKSTARSATALAIVLALTLVSISPVDVRPIGLSLALSSVTALLIAFSLIRFDLVTAIVSIFTFTLLWDTAAGWIVPSTPELVDAVLGLALVAGLGVLGFVSVRGGRSADDIPEIVPEYIEELTRKERLEREMELARSMQLSFLPAKTPSVPGLDIASLCLPAQEVGGDYYDFFAMGDQRIGFVVGDVSGKGMEAAFYMTLMKGMLQSLMTDGVSPRAALIRTNELFRANAARNTFMSMALGVIDAERGRLTYARAGHNPLLIRTADGMLRELTPSGPALGLMPPGSFREALDEINLPLSDGDLFVVYTDGVTEAMNPRRELYGEDRLDDVLARADGSANDLLKAIVEDVESFTSGAPSHDDMTLLIVRSVDAGRGV